MKFRKVALFFLIVSFGLIIEGINVTRNFVNDESFEGFRGLQFDGDFPFRVSRFRGPSQEFTETQTSASAGISGVEISNAFGDVMVRRTSAPNGQIGIALRKEVFTGRSGSAESVSEKVKLVLVREGGLLKVSTTRDPKANYRVKTHIEIDTPESLDTRVTNRHGRIVVEGAKALNVTGEFDEMKVRDVTGDCVAKNRHGSLEVVSAALGCRVEVEYGDVHVERLMAPSEVVVSHGNLSAVDLVALSAKLKFSDLQARKITGALSCDGEHSDLRIDDVKGDVTVKNRGDIDIQNITGQISIENRRGHVRLLKAGSSVMIRNSFDDVAASDVAGLLEITNEHGNIRAERFLKGARLESDSEDIDAMDFAGPLTVISSRGGVSVKPIRTVQAPIDVKVDIGDIHVGLPDSVNALLDAQVERGDVRGEVGALNSSEQGKRLLKATIGTGGPLLTLRSRLGDITVSREGDMEVSEPDSPNAPEVDARFRAPLGEGPRPARPIAPEPPAVPAPKSSKAPTAGKGPATKVTPAVPPAPPAPTPEGM